VISENREKSELTFSHLQEKGSVLKLFDESYENYHLVRLAYFSMPQ